MFCQSCSIIAKIFNKHLQMSYFLRKCAIIKTCIKSSWITYIFLQKKIAKFVVAIQVLFLPNFCWAKKQTLTMFCLKNVYLTLPFSSKIVPFQLLNLWYLQTDRGHKCRNISNISFRGQTGLSQFTKRTSMQWIMASTALSKLVVSFISITGEP